MVKDNSDAFGFLKEIDPDIIHNWIWVFLQKDRSVVRALSIKIPNFPWYRPVIQQLEALLSNSDLNRICICGLNIPTYFGVNVISGRDVRCPATSTEGRINKLCVLLEPIAVVVGVWASVALTSY